MLNIVNYLEWNLNFPVFVSFIVLTLKYSNLFFSYDKILLLWLKKAKCLNFLLYMSNFMFCSSYIFIFFVPKIWQLWNFVIFYWIIFLHHHEFILVFYLLEADNMCSGHVSKSTRRKLISDVMEGKMNWEKLFPFNELCSLVFCYESSLK